MDTLNDIISGLKWGDLDPVEAHDRVLALFSVSHRRELLIDFANELQNIGFNEMDDVEKVVDIWLKSN